MTMNPNEVTRKLHKREEFKAQRKRLIQHDPKIERQILRVESEIAQECHEDSPNDRLIRAENYLKDIKKYHNK